MTLETSPIKIYNTTKIRIEKMKGNQTMPVFIEGMVYYFEMTGLTPQTIRAHPSEDLKEGIERIVKIIRNIEKTKIDNLLEMMQKLTTGKAAASGTSEKDSFSKKDIEAMLVYKDSLEVALTNEKRKNGHLEKRITIATNSLNKIKIVDETANDLLSIAIKNLSI